MKKSKEQKNEDQLKIKYKIDSIDIAMAKMEETVKDMKISKLEKHIIKIIIRSITVITSS